MTSFQDFAKIFFPSFFLFVFLDLLWFKLFSVKYIYKAQFDLINGVSKNKKGVFRIWAAILVWIFMGLVATLFLLDVKTRLNNVEVLGYGMLIGFLIYGIYNFTNYATITKYKTKTVLADTLWGTLLFGTVCSIVNQI